MSLYFSLQAKEELLEISFTEPQCMAQFYMMADNPLIKDLWKHFKSDAKTWIWETNEFTEFSISAEDERILIRFDVTTDSQMCGMNFQGSLKDTPELRQKLADSLADVCEFQ